MVNEDDDSDSIDGVKVTGSVPTFVMLLLMVLAILSTAAALIASTPLL